MKLIFLSLYKTSLPVRRVLKQTYNLLREMGIIVCASLWKCALGLKRKRNVYWTTFDIKTSFDIFFRLTKFFRYQTQLIEWWLFSSFHLWWHSQTSRHRFEHAGWNTFGFDNFLLIKNVCMRDYDVCTRTLIYVLSRKCKFEWYACTASEVRDTAVCTFDDVCSRLQTKLAEKNTSNK